MDERSKDRHPTELKPEILEAIFSSENNLNNSNFRRRLEKTFRNKREKEEAKRKTFKDECLIDSNK